MHGCAHPRARDALVAPAKITLGIKPTSATSLNHSRHQMQQVFVGLNCSMEKNLRECVYKYVYIYIYLFIFTPPPSLQAFFLWGVVGFLFRSWAPFSTRNIFSAQSLLPPTSKAKPVFLTPQLIGSPAIIPTFLSALK